MDDGIVTFSSPFAMPQRSHLASSSPTLPAQTQWAYGIGEMGVVAPVSVSIFFLLFFLTQVVGLSPGQAGAILLVGRLWDAVNDPLVGVLSDVTPNFPRWGRRYPWMIGSAVPLAIACALQWWVPPLGQGGLLLYYGCMSILSYSFFTTVQIPFTALAAELTRDYDDRTRLMAFRSAFNILGSIVGLLLAKAIFAWIQDPVGRYSVLGLVLGGLVVVGLAVSVVGTYPHYQRMRSQLPQSSQAHSHSDQAHLRNRAPLAQAKTLWQNTPFRWLTGLYLGSWMGVKTTAAVLPYFVTAWMRLPDQHFIQMALTVQLSSILTTPFWSWLARRLSKRQVYLFGAPISMLGLLGLFSVQPGQISWMYGWGFVVGVGLSTFYLVPAAMLPDVIDVDAVNHGQRREGLFASVMVFLQKLALAIALFLTGAVLDWAGLVTGDSATGVAIVQPEQALAAIRWIMGPLPALSIGLGLVCAWFYPLSRELHDRLVNGVLDGGISAPPSQSPRSD